MNQATESKLSNILIKSNNIRCRDVRLKTIDIHMYSIKKKKMEANSHQLNLILWSTL